MNERKLTEEQREKVKQIVFESNWHRPYEADYLLERLKPFISPTPTFSPGEIQEGVDVYKKGGVQSKEEMVTAEDVLNTIKPYMLFSSREEKMYDTNKVIQAMHTYAQSVTAGVRMEIIQSEKERILIAQELSHHVVLFAAEYAYRKANPETKMDVPSIVYEDTEKAWRKYLDTIKPSSITAGVRMENGLTDEEIEQYADSLTDYDFMSYSDFINGMKHYRDNYAQSVPKEQGEGWKEIDRDNLPDGIVFAGRFGRNGKLEIMKQGILLPDGDYVLLQGEKEWFKAATHYRTIESLSLPTPPKPE